MNDPTPLTYEEARDQLLEIVARLEAGNVPLAESMDLWERGEKLAQTCERFLAGARDRVSATLENGSKTES